MAFKIPRTFICPHGHVGMEVTREYDQPVPDSVTTTGLIGEGHDDQGLALYVCELCGQAMACTNADK